MPDPSDSHEALPSTIKHENSLRRLLVYKATLCSLIILASVLVLVDPAPARAVDAAPTPTPTTSSDPYRGRAQPNSISAGQLNAANAAPGYCSSFGGSTQFENITGAILTPNGDGTMKLQVNVYIANPEGCVAGQECPSYDPSPEHVNAWIDWNGDKQWDEAERVMDKDLTGLLAINYAGTMTGISQFTIPAVFSETTWLRANLGYLHDPNDACEVAWDWGNVVDQQVILQAPKIKAFKVMGSKDVNNPMTTYGVKLEAVLETPSGFEVTKVSWSGDLKPGDGNPYTYTPDRGTQGKKKVTATVTYKNKTSGLTGQTSAAYEFGLFFEKKSDDNGDGKPNWFDYWGADGAVPGLLDPKVTYDATKGAGSYGAWSPTSDRVELGPAAAETHYPGGLAIDGTTYGNVRGIDAVAEVIAHELRHRTTINVNWAAGGAWVGKADADFHVPTNAYYDKLPDDYEGTFGTDKTKTDSKDLEHKKSAVYKYYGDNEYDAIVAGHGQKGAAAKDWANPGKQSNPVFAAAAIGEVQASTAGGPVTAASQYQTPAVVLPDLAQLTGVYTDAGLDTDHDGQGDVLRLTVGVDVTAPATYQAVGWLQSSTGANLAWAAASGNLSAGAQQLQLDFDGRLLRLQGENGPYKLAHIELRTGDDGDVVDFADNAYTTAAYAVTSFAAPAVTLTGAYADSGVDSNDNGLFDTLDVAVGVQVNRTGSYTLVGWLYAADGSAIPGAVATTAFTGSGAQTLQFDGKSMRWQRKHGPYMLRYLEVRAANEDSVAFLAQPYTTPTAYAATQFEPGGGAEMDADAYADQAIDLNGDGLYDQLRVTSTITANTAGVYHLSAALEDQAGQSITELAKDVSLHAGNNAVALDFPGGALRQHGVDGPYQLTQVMLATQAGDVIDYQAFAATTQPYPATVFAFPLVTLAGDFRDSAVDVDGDGQKDRLDVAVMILPGSSGVVIAQGRLVDKHDNEIQWVETNSAVTAGVAQTVTLPFSATQILAHGVDGPYVLKNVLIYNTGDPSQAVTDLPAYVTAGYRHTDLSIFIGAAATLAVTAAPNQLIADGSSMSEIAVVVKDAGGNPVPNQVVDFATTAGQLAASSENTDINGKVNVKLIAPTTVANATVTASAGTITRAAAVTFVAGPPAFITTAITPTTLPADGKSVATVRARLTDAFGNPLAGQVINFAASRGSITAGSPTDANGEAVAQLTAPGAAGVAQVMASVGALQTTASVTFVQADRWLYLPRIQR